MRSNWLDTIQESGHKVKARLENFMSTDVFVVVLVVLIGIAAFGLGRLSALEEKRPAIQIYQQTTTNDQGASLTIGGQYVASRKGSKYHFPWCSGAQRIKESNKISFNTREEAERAGYTPAANCKGL